MTVYRALPDIQDTDLNWTLISISTDGFTAPLKLIWSYKYKKIEFMPWREFFFSKAEIRTMRHNLFFT